MHCHHWTSLQESQVKLIALSLILFPQSRGFQFYFPHLVFPMNFFFFLFSLVHVTWVSNSTFLVCAYLDAFTDIFMHFMNVRRNWKVFSFCLKQAAINFFTHAWAFLCVRAFACAYSCTRTCTCTLMHMWPCLCTHAWLTGLYMYAAFAHQLILRPPVFHFINVNTSVDYECFCTFFNVSVLKSNVHSQCL
jgi:hypothetical protein